jgi:xanthine dehydrogenase accessory factor
MREIIPTIQSWLKSGRKMAMATVIRVERSSPRPMGSKMIVSNQGDMEGSISGGCVESSVVEEALVSIKDGKPRILHYGIDDSDPWSVGLACGGKIDVFVEPLFDNRLINGFTLDFFQKCIELVNKEECFDICFVISNNNQANRGILFQKEWVAGNSIGFWSNLFSESSIKKISTITEPVNLKSEQEKEAETLVFIEPVFPQPKMIVVGAVHIGVSLTFFAKKLGYKTIVIDPRKAFLSKERFPDADQLIQKWPQDVLPTIDINCRDCIAVLSHDEKIDLPAIAEALKSSAGYIGMLGSKKTKSERFTVLESSGINKSELQRVHGPIGLDIKAAEPAEIAISIMAEIIATKRAKDNACKN